MVGSFSVDILDYKTLLRLFGVRARIMVWLTSGRFLSLSFLLSLLPPSPTLTPSLFPFFLTTSLPYYLPPSSPSMHPSVHPSMHPSSLFLFLNATCFKRACYVTWCCTITMYRDDICIYSCKSEGYIYISCNKLLKAVSTLNFPFKYTSVFIYVYCLAWLFGKHLKIACGTNNILQFLQGHL